MEMKLTVIKLRISIILYLTLSFLTTVKRYLLLFNL